MGKSDWLAKIDALSVGDACEVIDHVTGDWVPAIVEVNGGPFVWYVTIDGRTHARYIELVRCTGQTDAWPRPDGTPR